MARGLHSNCKQPLGYFFVNFTFPASELRCILEDCIRRVSDIGLHVDAVLTDVGSNFIKLANNNSTFTVNEKNILYIFDTPHLIKATRNNLLDKSFRYEGKQTSWCHVKSRYEQDQN